MTYARVMSFFAQLKDTLRLLEALLCEAEKCTIIKILLSCTYIGSKSGFYRGFIGVSSSVRGTSSRLAIVSLSFRYRLVNKSEIFQFSNFCAPTSSFIVLNCTFFDSSVTICVWGSANIICCFENIITPFVIFVCVFSF